MYHRHPSWQHHDLYPTHPWPELGDALAQLAPAPAPPPPPLPAGPYTAYDALAPRLALAGSLDPATGIFYRSPEHPRLRTAQACEKCRTRKAKCSGEHPTCKRCATRGLVCEYAKEGRVRGPNKPKPTKPKTAAVTAAVTTTTTPPTPAPAPAPDLGLASPHPRAVRPRPSALRLASSSFGDVYAGTGDSPPARRSSCSSGGSLPSSAVSSTFELPRAPAPAPDYPPSTHIHQLTHEHQQRLLPRTDFDQPYHQQHYPMPAQQHDMDYRHWPDIHYTTDSHARYSYAAPAPYAEQPSDHYCS